jgi:hypothetical protein
MNDTDKLIQEISIRGGGILQNIRQPDNDKLNEGDLVFIYPIIMDATLEKKYGSMIRDFVTVAFVNRIKQANVLNVISDAVSPGTVKSGSGEINPAQLLKKHLGRSPQDEVDPDDMLGPQGIDYSKQADYNDALVQLREYVKDQIKNDPQYVNLRPVISQVMANNLIPIPLIIGTNMMKIHSSVLYWILFIACGQKIPLDRASSLDNIKRFLRQIPEDKYAEFMLNDKKTPDSMESPRKIQQMINGIQDGTDRATQKFYTVLSEDKWNKEVGVNSFTAQLTTAMHNTKTSQAAMSRRASTAFKSFVGNEIVGILQSITHAIVPETEVDISTKLSKFVDTSTNVRAHYDTIYDYIIGGSSSIEEVEELIKMSTDICIENKEINVNKIMSQLGSLHFGMRGTSRPRAFGIGAPREVTGGALLADFTEDIVSIGATLASFSKKLEEYVRELGGEQAVSELSDYKKSFRTDIENYFQGGWNEGNSITGTSIDNLVNGANYNPPPGGLRGGTPMDGQRSLFNSKRFQVLTGQIKVDPNTGAESPGTNIDNNQQEKFEQNMYGSLTEIMHFLSVFCFMSFFCDYLREIETEVTVQKRDAVSFPNYVLTTRIEYISRIYWALATRNFENEITEEKEAEIDRKFKDSREYKTLYKLQDVEKQALKRATTDQEREMHNRKIIDLEDQLTKAKSEKKGVETGQFRITSMGDTTKQINLIKERLKIPNIIVFDEKNKKVYYRFMFMPRVMNLDMGTMSSYVSQQRDVLSGF